MTPADPQEQEGERVVITAHCRAIIHDGVLVWEEIR